MLLVVRPLIGVVPLYDEPRNSFWMLPGYMQAIEHAGGIPVILPLTANPSVLRQLAKQFDGFLFTGGQDVAPELYGEQPADCCGAVCPERDTMEKMLLEYVLKFDKPVFGICRGIQFINVFLGGTLYQDIPSQFQTETAIQHYQQPPYHKPVHSVTVEPESPLFPILQTSDITLNTPNSSNTFNLSNKPFNIPVNSFHHQGIRRLATELKSAAYASDGLIEAVYHPDKRFVFAVQWHPELSWQTDSNSRKIFSYFVQHCGR
ncbi:MAG: gamma-glutamyl-gamma-aminobutyrate hydrolase family protein [Planctomycetaceae bacterium]|jgi:putative glutamine amidotransferase|nr:gamma-glutamyl-gamma-aminobutyrate hydrolase family protein [Planctomycetaceae bacterium]